MLRPCKILKTGSSDSDSSSAIKYHNSTASRDHLSQLSDDLLHFILKRLTVKDAVRTSVLSHRWKHLHSSISSLYFNPLQMFTHFKPGLEDDYRGNFIKAVNTFLEFYQGPCITSFIVVFRLGSDFSDDIDRWLGFANRKGAKKITLNLFCWNREQFEAQPEEEKYLLRKEVFDGTDAKINLKELYLKGCVLGPDLTNQFSSLKKLSLIYSPLLNYDLKGMFSCLLNLRKLELKRCTLPLTLYLASLTLLESLTVLDCVGIEDIELPNVKAIKLEGISPRLVNLKSQTVEAIDFCSATQSQLDDILSHVPNHLPKLKSLSVFSASVWGDQILERLVIFSKVKILMLHLCGEISHVMGFCQLVSILEAFPCLRVLNLLMEYPVDERNLLFRGVNFDDSDIGPKHEHVEYVRISGFDFSLTLGYFAIYLLKYATVLKRLYIKQEEKNFRVKRKAWNRIDRFLIYDLLERYDKNKVLVVLPAPY